MHVWLLQLDVKGCRNIYESFDRYTEMEVMEGANQYAAEGYGLQVRVAMVADVRNTDSLR
jgi:hypothetical protein